MPYADLLVHPTVTPVQAEVLTVGITDALVECVGKRREVTAVRIAPAAAVRWTIGGEPPAEPTAFLEVKITAGSNDAQEKAALIDRLDGLLREVLGGLAEASYIVVHELPAESWGYAGVTRAARRAGAR
ncbi:tautomerase family protein [Endothiovibrio diazotrophicus]